MSEDNVAINDNDNEDKKFVTWFQSVITIGIVTRAKDFDEADTKAKKIMADGGAKLAWFDQTPLEISDTEEMDEYNEPGMAEEYN